MIHSLHIGENFVALPTANGGIWRGELEACEADAVGLLRVAGALGAKTPMLLVTGGNDTNQPRKAVVRASIKELQAQAKPGDLVILSQSSHGSTDVFGQSLVYFDGLIYEEEIRSWLAGFVTGVRGLLIVDACFSGGLSTRGNFLQPKVRCAPTLAPDREHPRGLFGEPEIVSSWAVFAAAAANQPALDGDEFGAWTGALIRSWPGRIHQSPASWFNDAKAITPGDQTPTLGLLGKDHAWLDRRFNEFA